MSFIDLNSVGSTVTNEGLVFPIDCSEAPETASEAEEMMGVNIFECSDEWYWNLSLVDGYTLLNFLDESLSSILFLATKIFLCWVRIVVSPSAKSSSYNFSPGRRPVNIMLISS